MCCGRQRAAAQAAAMATPRAGAGPAVLSGSVMFELASGTEAIVRGMTSGRVYHFPHRGARVRVDPRDERALLADPRLLAIR